ncbi:MAG: hypothetical protein EXR75_10580 [Myxococcales bacterium]|nr:hypothetical protein [Myxococcales bacterium]
MGIFKKTCTPLLLVGLAAPALVNCDMLGGMVPGMDCPAMKDGNFAALKFEGAAEVEGELKGFLETVYGFNKTTVDMEVSLIESCAELGKALELDELTLKAEPAEGEGAKKVCGIVADKVKAMITAAGKLSISVEIGEPSCSADIDAMMACLSDCGSPVDLGQLDASCEGGEISGKCTADCTGSCTLEAGAKCGGSCTGTCKGKCDGKKSDASCAGNCEGDCSGTCKVAGKGACSGTCSGGCSAKVEMPKCSGTFKPPSVDPTCQLNCTAKTAATVTCTPPSVKIVVEGEASTEIQKLVEAMQIALPKIVTIQLGTGKRIFEAGKGLVEKGKALPSIAGKAGLKGVACIAKAASMTVSASASVSLSIEASANVSGSISGAGKI